MARLEFVRPSPLSYIHFCSFCDHEGDSVYSLPNFPDILHDGVIRGWLCLPHLPGNVHQLPWQPSKEQYKQGEPLRHLWHFADGKQDIGEEQVPVAASRVNDRAEYPLQSLVKVLDEAVGLGMVDHGAEVSYLLQLAQALQETNGLPWSVRMSPGMSTQLKSQFLHNVLRCCFGQQDCFGVAHRVIHQDEDVFVPVGGLKQQPYDVHPH